MSEPGIFADAPAIGARIEIPAHYDLWMRGARFGTVISHNRARPGRSAHIRVEMDHPQVRKVAKVWATDWEFVRVVS